MQFYKKILVKVVLLQNVTFHSINYLPFICNCEIFLTFMSENWQVLQNCKSQNDNKNDLN